MAFQFLHYGFLILISGLVCTHFHPTPTSVCPQHLSAVLMCPGISKGQWVNFAALGWAEGCWIKWAEDVAYAESKSCSPGLLRALNPRKVSIVLPAQLCQWSESYIYLHAKRCKHVAGSEPKGQRIQRNDSKLLKTLFLWMWQGFFQKGQLLPVFSFSFESSGRFR